MSSAFLSGNRPVKFLLAALVVIALISVANNSKTGALLEGLKPPPLPAPAAAEKQVWLDQGWSKELTQEFAHKTQGTHTIPIPLSWFLALEQPRNGLLAVPFGSEGLFSDEEYLRRFGFITGQNSPHNPHKLPVGLATTPFQTIPGIQNKQTAVGFTCAACHTGQIRHNNIDYIIEGGAATTDLGLLTKALAAAVGQTFASSKIPVFNGRFDRFAKKVLKEGYNATSMLALKADLQSLALALAKEPNEIEVIEGFTRLDAVNRIGNQVFALDPDRYENYVAINAPVAYPHIWTASWFDWVQYDGSIMQPLVRNAGEALGVRTSLNTTAQPGQKRFTSSAPIGNLSWIEESLAGATAPIDGRKFSGLLSPPWPDSFPAIDQAKAEQGKALYRKHCQSCHLPPLNSDEIWSDKYFAPITYYVNGEEKQTSESVLKLKMVALDQIGTDPAQAKILHDRTVNTAADVNPANPVYSNAMGIDAEVCVPAALKPQSPFNETMYRNEQPALVNVNVSDGPEINFALALGAVVQQSNDVWLQQNYISDELKSYYQGDRPNCLRAGSGYKARPLNGIWATHRFCTTALCRHWQTC